MTGPGNIGDPCPECSEPMDAVAVTFWRGEDPTNYDPETMTCTPCWWESQLGTRTPTRATFIEAGWQIPDGINDPDSMPA